MNISKTKAYTQIPLSELKDWLNIDESDSSSNGILTRLLKASIADAENYIQDDIILTTASLEDKNSVCALSFAEYFINTTNVSITSIQYSTTFQGTGLTTINSTDYTVEKYNSYSKIVFRNTFNCTRLVINYTSGWSSIPENVKTAIYMKAAALYDVERNGYTANVTNTKAFERLLQPYVIHIY